ncbi:MAG: DEAD/DEAH box helicase [Bacteroidia bacterium]|nr:DEAD/DEAH box helicase [Bacteroidia bacterium]
MKFTDYRIAPELKDNLERLGFNRPTDIQFKSIPHVLQGEDVLAVAQTGTGKTAAFAIPIIHILHDKKISKRPDGVKALIMAPTHELVIQLTSVFHKLGQQTRVKTFGIFGGVDQMPQIATLNRGVDILVATPGRMFDLVSQGHLDLEQVEILVLDEADHMLALGFLADIQQLTKQLPRRRQTLFFSATIDEEIKKLAYSLVKNAIRIQISPKDPVAKNITHGVAFIEIDDKRFFLERMIKENEDKKILVFVRTKVRAERVQQAMARAGIVAETIHGDKTQHDRRSVMIRFRSGELKVLIATDLTARGVDIPQVDYVINYDMPEQDENYVHRVGRTGRASHKGQAVSFCSEEEKPILAKIEAFLGHKIEQLGINEAEYQDTILFTEDTDNNWKALMKQAEEKTYKPKKKRSKKK